MEVVYEISGSYVLLCLLVDTIVKMLYHSTSLLHFVTKAQPVKVELTSIELAPSCPLHL